MVIKLRLRNVKNKSKIMNLCDFLITDPEKYNGKWKQEVFNNNNPIELEIGMGKGNFIIKKALNNPNINYIGIEKYDSIIARAIEKVGERIPNLFFVRMDALNIDNAFNKEISKIYLNFSDPWPKKRHASRRLTSSVFLKKYDDLFEKNKIICQKTDNQSLFEYSIVSLSNNGYVIKELSFDLHNSEIENIETTEYEDKFCKKGNKIYYLLAEKDTYFT